MDPGLFRIDRDVLAEVLAAIIVLSLSIERAVALLLGRRLFVQELGQQGIKEPIALGVSLAVVARRRFDALAVLFHRHATSGWEYFVTAANVTGRSKASVAPFHHVMNATRASVRDLEAQLAKQRK